jgi:hypothetical protein
MQTTTNISAILAGEQRSNRFRYRHSVAGAAKEVGIPATWIWYWLFAKRLKSKIWLRKVWLRLEAVQKLVADPDALRDGSYATGELLTSPEAILQVVKRPPERVSFKREIPAPAKRAAQPVKPDPVLCEELVA